MAKVLGRITSMERPRGPDVQMSVTVPEEWMTFGATLEIDLPRNLACASCGGGGCDACERSGAVSLRGRKEPTETVEVTLPSPGTVAGAAASKVRIVVFRIPDRGGQPAEGVELPRGNLLLSIRTGLEPAPGVTRLAQPSIPPPPPVEILSVGVDALGPTAPARRRAFVFAAAAALVALALAWWLKR
jgi:hypothetical protein